MSDSTLFILGAVISIIWGIGCAGPFFYAATKAETAWLKKKQQKKREE
jgi:hypothetical protein